MIMGGSLPSTGNRGAGPVVLWAGIWTDDVSKKGGSWEGPDLGDRAAVRGRRNLSVHRTRVCVCVCVCVTV